MFENLKKKYAHFIIRRHYLEKNATPINYNRILTDSIDFLFIMPKDDKDFFHAMDILRYFLIHKKVITLFLPEYKYNLVPEKEKYKCLSFMPGDITRFNLPNHELKKRLHSQEFDVVIDLNRDGDIFFSAVANSVRAKVRAGFSREMFGKYYNLLINQSAGEGESSYRSFLTYLKMF